MNPDVLLNRIRLEQRGLIDIHKKLYEMEHLLPVPDPMQFAKTAESAALLSEKSTAHLRNMFFSVSNEPPIYYYPKAAEGTRHPRVGRYQLFARVAPRAAAG